MYAGFIWQHWNKLATLNPNLVAQALEDGGLLTIGIFGGLDGAGRPQMADAVIAFNKDSLQRISSKSSSYYSCPLNGFCVIGRGEVVIEFLTKSSERARQEARSWSPDDGRTPQAFFDVRRAVRLAELTKRYQQGSAVGGPIDAVQINRDGHAEWYQRKPNCPAN
jgi:hypothetical protein